MGYGGQIPRRISTYFLDPWTGCGRGLTRILYTHYSVESGYLYAAPNSLFSYNGAVMYMLYNHISVCLITKLHQHLTIHFSILFCVLFLQFRLIVYICSLHRPSLFMCLSSIVLLGLMTTRFNKYYYYLLL